MPLSFVNEGEFISIGPLGPLSPWLCALPTCRWIKIMRILMTAVASRLSLPPGLPPGRKRGPKSTEAVERFSDDLTCKRARPWKAELRAMVEHHTTGPRRGSPPS